MPANCFLRSAAFRGHGPLLRKNYAATSPARGEALMRHIIQWLPHAPALPLNHNDVGAMQMHLMPAENGFH